MKSRTGPNVALHRRNPERKAMPAVAAAMTPRSEVQILSDSNRELRAKVAELEKEKATLQAELNAVGSCRTPH